MNIVVTIMFLLPLALVTLYLYLSGVFTNRRAFQCIFSILVAFFVLIIGVGGIQLSYQAYDLQARTPVALSEILSEPSVPLQQTRCTPP